MALISVCAYNEQFQNKKVLYLKTISFLCYLLSKNCHILFEENVYNFSKLNYTTF